MMGSLEYKKRLIRIWLFGFAGLALLIGSVNGTRLLKVYRDGIPIDVTVRDLDADSRSTVKYSYDVGGTQYEGEGQGGFGNPSFEHLHVGDKLKGYYESGDPSISCLGEPKAQLLRETIFTVSIALAIPSLIVLRASFRYKKWLKQNKENQV